MEGFVDPLPVVETAHGAELVRPIKNRLFDEGLAAFLIVAALRYFWFRNHFTSPPQQDVLGCDISLSVP